MRLYLDQMFRKDLAALLREHGHDVVRAEEVGQDRADDEHLLEETCHQDRTLITLDEHFGDWVVLPLSRHPGVIRIKVHPPTTERIAELLVSFLDKTPQEKLCDHLVILSEKRERWVKTSPD